MNPDTITVLGAGYVGLTTAALLAHAGYKVYLVEPNKDRLNVIKQGRSFFYEEGLDSVVKQALGSGSLIPTDSYELSVPSSAIVFSCVGTPDNPDGSLNLTYVMAAAQSTAQLAHSGMIYVQKSTVPVGTGSHIEKLFHDRNANFDYVSNPEFLREGTALRDTLFFDRVVAGGSNSMSVQRILDTYRKLEANRDDIAHLAGIQPVPYAGEYIATELASAELIKVTSNAFLALKISFANSIAKLADKAGADIVEVMDGVGADKRIGRAFLSAGRGYGGGCFPKDVSGLLASGLEHGTQLDILQATQLVNASMPGYIVEKLQKALGGSLENTKVAVLGLAFKAGTSDARRSPGVTLANLLTKSGAVVTTYDPKAGNEAALMLVKKVHLTYKLNDCLQQCNVVVIATDWPEFITMKPTELATLTDARIIVDAVNALPKHDFTHAGFTYLGVGR